MQGDITSLIVDAIVNAANSSLLGGGGVDGAIHRTAGPELIVECGQLGGCNTGDAKITRGYRLPAKHVIHAVGPVWHGGQRNENELLASCYRRSLEIASENKLKTIAFPCISTGAYWFPPKDAADIAIATTEAFARGDSSLHEIIFCCFSQSDYKIYSDLLTCLNPKQRTSLS